MAGTTTIRVDRETHRELQRLAVERETTIAETVTRAVRVLRQDEIGRELAEPLGQSDAEWLDAELR